MAVPGPQCLMEMSSATIGLTQIHLSIANHLKKDKDALNRIKANLQKVFDKINSGAIKLTADQIESIHSQNRIYVSNDNP